MLGGGGGVVKIYVIDHIVDSLLIDMKFAKKIRKEKDMTFTSIVGLARFHVD